MNERTNKRMNELANKRMNDRTNKRTNERTNKRMNERTNKRMNERTNKRMNELANKRMNERTDKRMNEWTNKRMNEQANKRMNERTNKGMNERTNWARERAIERTNKWTQSKPKFQANVHELLQYLFTGSKNLKTWVTRSDYFVLVSLVVTNTSLTALLLLVLGCCVPAIFSRSWSFGHQASWALAVRRKTQELNQRGCPSEILHVALLVHAVLSRFWGRNTDRQVRDERYFLDPLLSMNSASTCINWNGFAGTIFPQVDRKVLVGLT